jgi:hypothetical protein
MSNNDSLWLKEPSVFAGHSLVPIHKDPIFRSGTIYYWPVSIMFLILILYVSIRIFDPKKLLKVFASPFSLQTSKQLLREDYKINKRVSVFLSFAFILVISYLVYITNRYFGLILQDINPIKQYLFFIITISLMYIVKFSINYLLSQLTLTKDLGKEYIFNVSVFCQTAGVVLFPFIICIQFSRYSTELFLYPAIIICIVMYLLRLFRGFVISVIEQNIGIFYIFLYLCALEILPIFVLIKFLLVNFKY